MKRLPAELQAAHAEWAERRARRGAARDARRNARRVAFTLLEQGDDADHVERVLHAMGFHPAIAHDSARWAYERHRDALDHAPIAATPAA